MVTDRYDVTLVGFPAGAGAGEAPPEALARIFGIDLGEAERVVATAPVVIKHGATAGEARAYGAALEGIGARVRISESLHAPAAESPRGPATPRPAPPQGGPTFGPSRAAPPVGRVGEPGTDGPRCAAHPGSHAVASCLRCGRPLCAGCVCRDRVGEVEATLCPSCHAAEGTRSEAARPGGARAFLAELPRAFVYPFRGRGAIMLVVGALFFAGASWLASLSIFGFLVTFFVAGYLAAYMTKVVAASSDGEDEAPDWPEFGSFVDDILWPIFRVVAAVVVCFGPAAVPFFVLDPSLAVPVALALVAVGTVTLPMALLSLSIHRTVWALNPILIVRGLAATWRVYPLALLAMVLVYVGVSVLQLLPGVGLLLGSFLSLWLLLVEMRILGVLYRTHADRFGWL